MESNLAANKFSWVTKFLSFPIISVLAGVIAISNTITYGALIFTGALSPYLFQGIGIALFSGFVLSLVLAIFSSGRGMVAFPQAAIAPILGLLTAQAVAELPPSASSDEIFFTIVAALGFSSFFTGMIFLTFGRFRLGKAFRFMPYPVFGGFLAGLGWLLVKGGLTFLAEEPLHLEIIEKLQHVDFLLHFAPGVILAIVILIAQRKYNNPALVPFILMAGVGLFYLIAYVRQIGFDTLAEQGWLLGPFPDGVLWKPINISTIYYTANWPAIFKQTLTLLTITFTCLISVLFNTSGIELETKQDVRLDQELQAAGVANIITSFGGGLVGFPSTSISLLPYRIGNIKSRWTGIFISAYFALTIFYGATILSYIPKWAVGGMLVYLGLSFLFRWVILGWKSLPKSDYIVMLLIFSIIISFGLLEGVLVGVIATAVLFAINYSRTNVIRNTFSRANYKSNVERNIHQESYLKEKGEEFYILKLQGFIFFGTAFNLLQQVRDRTNNRKLPKLRFLVLDFHLVNGIDSSAINSFARIKHSAANRKIHLVLSKLSPAIEKQLISEGFIGKETSEVQYFSDIDHALEWCEEKMLADDTVTIAKSTKLKDQIQDRFVVNFQLDDFFKYLEHKTFEKNAVIIADGAPSKGIYFIESGEATIHTILENGEILRYRTIGGGSIVGELGMYLHSPASANVIAQTETSAYFLSNESLLQMEQENPEVAAFCHKYLATILSHRLQLSNSTLQATLN